MSDKINSILFDLDGVFYEADSPIDGAAEAYAWVKDNAIPHLFLTNTTSKPRSALVDKLENFGITTDQDHILTPVVAAINWLTRHKITEKIALFIPEGTQSEFSDFETIDINTQDVANAVILGDLGERWDFPTLNKAFRMLMNDRKPVFIAMGMTRYWHTANGLQLGLEYASGVSPLVVGKPNQLFYQAALDILGVNAGNALMIGDDIKGDIQGSQTVGCKAVLVKTGKYRPSDLEIGITPDKILPSVKALPDLNLSKL